MNIKEELLKGLEESTNALSDVLAAFSAVQFGQEPAPDKWSAAEVAEHLILLEKIVGGALSGFCVATHRDPFLKKRDIEGHMSNFERAFKAPEFIRPSGHLQQQDAIDQLISVRKMTSNLVMVSDVTETCMDTDHPGFGQLTRGEWVYFDISHANRHLRQLLHIKEQLT